MGNEVSVIDKGRGEPLLMLHGYRSSKESFYYQIEALSRCFRVIAPDLPGFDVNYEMPYPFSLDDYCRFTEGIIRQINADNVRIMAHSFGGRIALKLVSEKRVNCEKLLLTGCAGMKPRRSARYVVRRAVYRVRRLFESSEKLVKKYASPDYLALSPVMRDSFKLIINEHLDGCLPKINCQTLLVFGSMDTETPLYMARRLNKGIRQSALIVFEGASHFCFVDNPDKFNATALEFFR